MTIFWVAAGIVIFGVGLIAFLLFQAQSGRLEGLKTAFTRRRRTVVALLGCAYLALGLFHLTLGHVGHPPLDSGDYFGVGIYLVFGVFWLFLAFFRRGAS